MLNVLLVVLVVLCIFAKVEHSAGHLSVRMKKSYKLWKDENLNDEDADEDQTGAGDVVFEGWQSCCSVLEKKNSRKHLRKDTKEF